MKQHLSRSLKVASLVGALALSLLGRVAPAGAADEGEQEGPNVHAGRAEVYKQLKAESLEAVSTPEQIMNLVTANGTPAVAATEIWRVLEHGEKLECLNCIPYVSKLLYNANPKTREISAWWLRRRIFGVFGPGQVYEQTVKTLADASESEQRRAYAANALGEFLAGSGVPLVAKAAVEDASPLVRAAAVGALERLNSQGPNAELAVAMGDSDENVRLAAVRAATRIHVFTDVAAVVALIGDPSSLVRRKAAEALGAMRASDAVLSLSVLASEADESDASVRAAAVWALGQIGDPEGRDAVNAAREDSDRFVRNAAAISARILH